MQRVYARNTTIKDISNEKSLVREFLEQNHLQGYCRGNRLAYGLYHKDELVQIMTFGSPRYNRNYQLELIRECTRKGTQVIGGSSKLWKHFIKVNPHVHSVICYTDFNHKHELEFTNHYVKHLGFTTLTKPRKGKERQWVSDIYPRNDKYGKMYPDTLIKSKGPDRVLGTKFGTTQGKNEDLMTSLGYHIEERDYIHPQTDIWYKGGYIYKVTHTPSGRFYIGMSEKMDKTSIETYLGSGTIWRSILKTHPITEFVKEILAYTKTPKETYKLEIEHIKKYADDPLNQNIRLIEQGNHTCSECMSFASSHKKTCSKYIEHLCTECESVGKGSHKKTCSKYNGCIECGSKIIHLKTCSLVQQCEECGAYHKHKIGCSKYIETIPVGCIECGAKYMHKKTCSTYIPAKGCSLCDAKRGHKKTCKLFKQSKPCEYCNTKKGHTKDCKLYNRSSSICKECQGKNKHHKTACSLYTAPPSCLECNKIYGHKKICSQYKGYTKCTECGSGMPHKKTCSKHKYKGKINNR